MDVVAMGRTGLTGMRGRLGQSVAGPVADRTGLTREQVEAIIGGAFLLLTLWQFLRVLQRAIAAGRSGGTE
jgi:hypothetical protein